MGLGYWQNFRAVKLGSSGCCLDGAVVHAVFGLDDVGRDRCCGIGARPQRAGEES